ncbi:expressed unknown protein [Seminavis robusta]|uniref:Uncharacterized protein n=1 Tax=Seminavis robusta TaxID=568900 RepID=A0A9N8EE76_9STRA|nr:expressed unknown protein [Seminavis robusta]CAB9519832.1 expressed unknown protein [Seminavis robusta]CAB9519835.1 expressed unknown protein [Seminavis robusta]|eukprot:Sro1050_g235570.1 n/a (191) ;mRNA; r:28636-29208
MKTISFIVLFASLFVAKAQDAPSSGLRGTSNVASALGAPQIPSTLQATNLDVASPQEQVQPQDRSVLITIQFDSKFQVDSHRFELTENQVNGWRKMQMWGSVPRSGFVARTRDDLKEGYRYDFAMTPEVPESTRNEQGNVKVEILDITHVQGNVQAIDTLIEQGVLVYSFEEELAHLLQTEQDIFFTFSM